MLPYDYGRRLFDATPYEYGRRLFDATIIKLKYGRHGRRFLTLFL